MKFIKEIFTDSDGSPSSKRVVMFILLFLFVGVSIYNLCTGKNLDDTLKNQLFYLLCWIFSTVIGEKVVNIFTTKPVEKKDEPKVESEK